MSARRWLLLILTASLVGSAPPALAQRTAPSAALARLLATPLWTRSQVDSARQLLRQGASYQTQSPRGITILMLAAKAGDVSMLRAALQAGVDVNARTRDGQELTALMLAMSSRSEEKVRELLRAGADVDAQDRYGRTPLMLATHFKFRRGIALLVARGAKVNARNRKGATALAYADSHAGISRLLRQHGVTE